MQRVNERTGEVLFGLESLVMAWKFPYGPQGYVKNPATHEIFGRHWTYFNLARYQFHSMIQSLLLCGVWLKGAPPTLSVTWD